MGKSDCKTFVCSWSGCTSCIDSKVIKILGKNHIFRLRCKCDFEREQEEKKREKQQKIAKMKQNCFKCSGSFLYTFENIDENTDPDIIKKAKSYVDNFDEMIKDNIGLLLYGSVGSGKTYIACAIANRIIEKYEYTAKMINLGQAINDLQKGGFDFDRNRYIDKITNPKLLILDDFGIERHSEYALEQIYNIINSRYEKNKPTIITTNINFKDIQREQENIMLGRLYSRIIEMCIPFRIVGEDRRKRHRIEKLNKAKNILEE